MTRRRGYETSSPEVLEDRVVLSGAASAMEGQNAHHFGELTAEMAGRSPAVAPLSTLTLQGKFKPGSTVEFVGKGRGGNGYKLVVEPISATSSSIAVPVPLYANPKGGAVGSGVVQVDVLSPSGHRMKSTVNINSLTIQSPTTIDAPPGTLTSDLLNAMIDEVEDQEGEVIFIENASNNLLNASPLISAYSSLAQALDEEQADVQAVMSGQAPEFDIGTSGGKSVIVNPTSLALMDQMIATSPIGGTEDGGVLMNQITQYLRTFEGQFVGQAAESVDSFRGAATALVAPATALIGSVALGLATPEALALAGAAGAIIWGATTFSELGILTGISGGFNEIISGHASPADFTPTALAAAAAAQEAAISQGLGVLGELGATSTFQALSAAADEFQTVAQLIYGDQDVAGFEGAAGSILNVIENAIDHPSSGGSGGSGGGSGGGTGGGTSSDTYSYHASYREASTGFLFDTGPYPTEADVLQEMQTLIQDAKTAGLPDFYIAEYRVYQTDDDTGVDTLLEDVQT